MNKLLLLGGALVCAALLPGQSIVAPDLYTNAEAPSGTGVYWRNGVNRAQQVYDTSHFTNQGIVYPVTITRLQWRASGNSIGGGGIYPSVMVSMSSCPNDWTALSTTFANNQGVDNTVVHNGPVTLIPGLAQSPNIYVVDIPLTTSFVYDPTLGLDLVVEVDYATGPGVTPATIDADLTPATARGTRLSSTTLGATTGTTSAFVVVLKMDYIEPPGVARTTKYGPGCIDNRSATLYEDFAAGPPPTFDLNPVSPATVSSVLMTPNNNGGYDVSVGSNNWFTPTSTALPLGDDTISPAQALGFPLAYPGGSTNGVQVCYNGYLHLTPTTSTSGDFSPSVGELLSGPPRLFPAWNDWRSSAGSGGQGNIYFDVDGSNTAAFVTFDGVGEFNSANTLYANTFQVAMFSNGSIEFRYQNVANNEAGNNLIVGFSSGAGTLDPGNVDLSSALPFSNSFLVPLDLDSSARPLQGTTINLVTNNIPATAHLTGTILSFTQISPGIDLSGIGMPGCFQHVGNDITHILFGSPSVSVPLTIPIDPSWLGAQFYGQSASLVPGINPLSAISSNGACLTIGTL